MNRPTAVRRSSSSSISSSSGINCERIRIQSSGRRYATATGRVTTKQYYSSLLLLLLLFNINNIQYVSCRAIITIMDYNTHERSSYFGQVGNFGKQLPTNTYLRGHIMLPPDRYDPYLCRDFSDPQYIELLKKQQLDKIQQDEIQDELNTNNNTQRPHNITMGVAYTNDTNTNNNIFTPEPNDTINLPDDNDPNNNVDSQPIIVKDVALFVSRGNCTFEDKARNVIQLQPYTHHNIKYLIVYNNNPDELHDLVVMSSSNDNNNNDPSNDDNGITAEEAYLDNRINEELSNIFVSTVTASDILDTIYKTHKMTDASPRISVLDPRDYAPEDSNRDWDLQFIIEALSDDEDGSGGGYYGGGQPPWGGSSGSGGGSYRGSSSDSTNSGATTFYWLRFILFAILILSPCIRAGYLWWSGGGRILMRRNSNGWFVGFQFVRPAAYWYATAAAMRGEANGNGNDPFGRSRPTILTEEQVMALPIITYVKPPPTMSPTTEDNAAATAAAATTITPVQAAEDTTDDDDDNNDEEQQQQHKHPKDDDNVDDAKVGEEDKEEEENNNNVNEPDGGDKKKDNEEEKQKQQEQEQQLEEESVAEDGAVAIDINDSNNNDSNDDNNNDTSNNDNNVVVVENDNNNNSNNKDEDETLRGSNTSNNTEVTTVTSTTSRLSEELEDNDNVPSLTTTCTSCSICIDEFDEGEELCLLPRCKHAFHLECIKPWLTERQGCCPLCKTCVMEEETEPEPEHESSEDDDDGGTQQQQQQQAGDDNDYNDDFAYMEGGVGLGGYGRSSAAVIGSNSPSNNIQVNHGSNDEGEGEVNNRTSPSSPPPPPQRPLSNMEQQMNGWH